MLESISPYALLCASKPKPTPTLVTRYDLYSAAQSSPIPQSALTTASGGASVPSGDLEPSEPTPSAVRMPHTPVRRTHYIDEIQNRHNAALRRTAQLIPPRM